jgi:hypothetical protein
MFKVFAFDPSVGCASNEVSTAFGCISGDPATFFASVFRIAVGIGGGIAFFLVIFGIFELITSGADPEKLNDAKDRIVSALSGLLVIIFAIVFLRIIGVDILQLQGFK